MAAPSHFLEVKLGRRPQPAKSEPDEEEERRKRHRENNRVAAAPGQNRKEVWEGFCSRSS